MLSMRGSHLLWGLIKKKKKGKEEKGIFEISSGIAGEVVRNLTTAKDASLKKKIRKKMSAVMVNMVPT